MLNEAGHFTLAGEPPALVWDTRHRCLALASQRRDVSFTGSEAVATALLERVPHALDAFDNRAFWDADAGQVLAVGDPQRSDTPLVLMSIPAGASPDERLRLTPTDLTMGVDGILYIARGGRVLMHDRRDRWNDADVGLDGFVAWRLAADADTGVWVLDRDNRRVAHLSGTPLPRRAEAMLDATTTACDANPNPPVFSPIDQAWPEGETPVAIASNLAGRVAVLCWTTDGAALIREIETPVGRPPRIGAALGLAGVEYPFSLGFASADTAAVLIGGVDREAVVYDLDGSDRLPPVGDLYPLKAGYDGGPFAHVSAGPSRTVVRPTGDAAADEFQVRTKVLRALSFPFFARHGEAHNNAVLAPLDSRDPNMVWHRLFAEAVLPKGTRMTIWLAATTRPVAPATIPAADWFEHRFGTTPGGADDVPTAAWESRPSEIGHHPGLTGCPIEPQRAGLFGVLIQRPGRAVRRLRGRYLHVHIEMYGDGRATPRLFALRAYGSRFSYVDEYLPQFYRQTLTGADADAPGQATPEDFLDRMVGSFEGVLTGIEDAIATSYLLTEPATAPPDALPWLGDWIGAVPLPGVADVATQRRALSAAPYLHRWRGTIRGLKLALDIATSGGVAAGNIVVLEDFRLRRTFATILGADLDDHTDPLTTGAAVSGNAYVGDTLFVGDQTREEFLALFSADLALDAGERAAVEDLFTSLAFRVTVLVHETTSAEQLGVINAVVAREAPAHVAFRVVAASRPLLVGMAALVGVDTYLTTPPAPAAVETDTTRIGGGHTLTGPAALDRRLAGIGDGGPTGRPPTAAAADATHGFGETAVLDASASVAYDGRTIETYTWTLLNEVRGPSP